VIPRVAIALPALVLLSACASVLPPSVPDESPPLADMEINLMFAEEPRDEADRVALARGSFSGLVVASARMSLDDAEPGGLKVVEVIENSPADAAGLEPDDILFLVTTPDGIETELGWLSEWRKIELDTAPGTGVTVLYDRAGIERETTVTLIPRVRPAGREEVARYRENLKVGVVLRTATEVEARTAGLGPGGGAVVIGLSQASPWRKKGIRYGDLLVEIDGEEVAHPQVVLDAIRDGTGDLTIEFFRDGKKKKVTAALTRRRKEVKQFYIPVLYDYERDGDRSEMSILLGLFGYTSTAVATRYRVLWFIMFSRGDADRLVEEKNP